MGTNVLLIVVALLLVLLNGFFVAAEFGIVKLRNTRVKAIAAKHGLRGRILATVHKDLDAYLSACQLGITLASLGLGWIGEPAFARLLEPLLGAVGIVNEDAIHAIAFTVAFLFISYLHIVVGELAPKSMAIRVTENVGLWTAAPLYAFYWLMYPAIWALNHSSNWILRRINLDVTAGHDIHYSTDELKLILNSSRPSSGFTADEWRVVAHALDFRDLEVADLMRSFSDVVSLSATDDIPRTLDRIAETRYSRYPVLDASQRIIGVVHVKDIFSALRKGNPPSDLTKLVRPAVVVRPDFPAIELFRRFREGAPHFVIVAYPDERPVGFITLDNLLSVLVGEIRDEFRQAESEWVKLDDGSLLGKGTLPIYTLERALGIDVEDTGPNSVGGLIIQQLGALPEEGQRVSFDRFDIVVRKMNGPRIASLQIYPKRESATP